MEKKLILVNENDIQLGTLEKMMVHKKGYLHRAFSIFVFNTKGELLLQQRATNKYHSANKWSNTCCSHPIDGEPLDNTIHRRLYEEMGIQCTLQFVFKFTYKAFLDNGIIENELDYVYMGISNDIPKPNNQEVKNWCYMDLQILEKKLCSQQQQFSNWLHICFDNVKKHFYLNIAPQLNK